MIARLDRYNTFTDPACMSPGPLKEHAHSVVKGRCEARHPDDPRKTSFFMLSSSFWLFLATIAAMIDATVAFQSP